MLITLDHLLVNEFAALNGGPPGAFPHPLGRDFDPQAADPEALSNLLTVVMRREARQNYDFRRLFMKIIKQGQIDVLRSAIYDGAPIDGLKEFIISVAAAVKIPTEEMKAEGAGHKRKRDTGRSKEEPMKKAKREEKTEPSDSDSDGISFPPEMMKDCDCWTADEDEEFDSDFADSSEGTWS